MSTAVLTARSASVLSAIPIAMGRGARRQRARMAKDRRLMREVAKALINLACSVGGYPTGVGEVSRATRACWTMKVHPSFGSSGVFDEAQYVLGLIDGRGTAICNGDWREVAKYL